LSNNLNHVRRISGFTRVVILARAEVLGLSFCSKRRWTDDEIESLCEASGTVSTSHIAKRLGRTYYSVRAQITKMGLTARVSADYSQQDVEQLLGVGRKRVCQWINHGWLQLLNGRVTERSLARFLRVHPEEYRLSRVDEAWFKGILFPSFGQFGGARHATERHKAEPQATI
jgi:hypothetical protein